MIKVLIVEDSPTTLAVLRKIISQSPDMEVVGEAQNGKEAVDLAAELSPDVITMDIFMPVMDGCTATKHIMESNPRPIIVVTAHDVKELGSSFDVLAAGALDIIRKPRLIDMGEKGNMADELLFRIRSVANMRVFRRTRPEFIRDESKTVIRSPQKTDRNTLLIGGSAGAPGVLADILHSFTYDFAGFVAIVQHMSSPFVEGFISWLDSQSPLTVQLATDGEKPQEGHVYLPPAEHHIGFNQVGNFILNKGPNIKGHRPSIDFLFKTAAETYKNQNVAVLLSGMGDDGVEGARAIRNRNGLILVQDPKHSLVTGIPQAAVNAGVASTVLTPGKIIYHLERIFTKKEG